MPEDFSVVTIARNEAKTLPRLLDSLKGVSDIVIIDTGSEDATVQVASDLGAKVIEVEDTYIEIPKNSDIALFKQRYGFLPTFTNESRLFNYAAARNFGMTQAENDFCFQPDCDEIVDWDLEAVRQLLPNCDQLTYRFCFAHNPDGTPLLEFSHCKFFRRSVAHWVKKVHEVVAHRDDIAEKENLERILYTDKMYLHHWQETNLNRSNMLPKLEYSILEKPNDDRNTYYLAREYYYGGLEKADTAIMMFEHYLKLGGWKPERGQALIFMGECYKWKGDRDQAIMHFHKAMIEDDTRREPFFALGIAYWEWKDYRRAAIYLNAALEIPLNPNYYLNDMNLYTWKIHDILSLVYDKLGEDKKAQYHWLEAVKAAPEDQRIIDNAKWFWRKQT